MKIVKTVIYLGIILVLTSAAFFPSLFNGFTNWDDYCCLNQNEVIKNLTWNNIRGIFAPATYISSKSTQPYVPLVFLSYAAEFHFFKLNPFPYHVTNLLFHMLNCVLVFWLVNLLSQNRWISFMTAALFGLHPLRVESVAWIAERKDVLYAFFFLAASICYIYYIRKSKKYYYYFVVIFFVMALLSKPMAVSLPFVLFIYDYILKGVMNKDSWRNKAVPFILSFAYAALYFIDVTAYGSRNPVTTVIDKMLMANYAILFYLSKIMLPVKLSCIYPHPLEASAVLPLIFHLSLFLTPILFLSALYSLKYSKKIVMGGAFFLVTISPALLTVASHQIVADRFTYLPSIGIFFIVAEFTAWLYVKKMRNCPAARAAILSVAVISIMGLAIMTWNRCMVWKDSITLFSNVLEQYPDASIAYNNRGIEFFARAEYDKAGSDFARAVLISRKHNYEANPAVYYINLANVYRATGRKKEAESMLKNGIRAYPNEPYVYFHLAYFDDSLQDAERGVMFKKAMLADPFYLPPYIELAKIYLAMGKREDLAMLYLEAIKNNLDYFEAYYNMANSYMESRRYSEAVPLYKRAVEIDPASSGANAGLGSSYCAVGKTSAAENFLKRAIALNPNLAIAHYNLSVAYYCGEKYGLAVRHCDKAAELGYPIPARYAEMMIPYRR